MSMHLIHVEICDQEADVITLINNDWLLGCLSLNIIRI